ncbi:MAG: LysR family transcriptional regulator [Candidatus Omnitrophota bacterium]
MKIKSKVWLEEGKELIFGKGKSDLLKAIDETGSISKASEKMGISFRHGWGYVTAIEKRLGTKLIERSKGGKDGGGSRLTARARELISKFDILDNEISGFSDTKFKEIFLDGNRSAEDR